MKLHKIILVALVLAFSANALAQFKLDGQFRPRAEFRNGFGTLIAKNAEPAFAVSTRARLNAGYKESLKKSKEIGKEEVIQHEIYIKFICTPEKIKGVKT